MKRCSWCSRILWPWQDQSQGRTMHFRCCQYVLRITAESDAQYTVHPEEEYLMWQRAQAELRWKEEDRL